MQIETDRLVLRPTRLGDVVAIFAILSQEEAMRFTHCFPTLRACRRHVLGHAWQRRRRGYAPWTVLDRTTGVLVGWGGLFDDPFDPGYGPEVGYWFSPACWGRGYATELTAASLAFARDRVGLPEVQAFVRPDHHGSRRVLEKAGFARMGHVPALGRDRYVHNFAP